MALIIEVPLKFSVPDPGMRRRLELGVQGATRILDVGCNHGYTSKLLLGLNRNKGLVTGVDRFPCKGDPVSRIPGLAFRNLDLDTIAGLEGLAYEPSDLVYCSQVIEHLEAPLEFLHAVARGIDPGGLLFISTVCRDREASPSPRWLYRNRYGVSTLHPGHLREYACVEDLTRGIEAAGFRILASALSPVAYPLIDVVLKHRRCPGILANNPVTQWLRWGLRWPIAGYSVLQVWAQYPIPDTAEPYWLREEGSQAIGMVKGK